MRFAAAIGSLGLLAAQSVAQNSGSDYEQGLTHFRAGRLAEARPYLERATQQSPDQAEAWKVLGLVLLNSNDFQAASKTLSKACALNPKDEDACYLLGRSLFVQGRYSEAVEPFEKACSTMPAPAAHRAAALNLAELGRSAETEHHFREAVRLYRGGAPDPRVDYGAFLIGEGRVQEALPLLRKSAAEAPNNARAQGELGRALLELDRPAEALVPLETAVKLDPKAWATRMILGKTYMRLGRTEEGERELRLGREGWAKQDYGSSKVK